MDTMEEQLVRGKRYRKGEERQRKNKHVENAVNEGRDRQEEERQRRPR